jgi:predicted nucleotidyltransferase
MDLSDPTRALTPTLDGAVLSVLASAGRPLSVGQVAEAAVRGSEIGIRRCLARLVDQGLVRATLMGRNHVFELNRDHVAAEAAVLLSGLRTATWDRITAELRSWHPRPLYAAVFGSAARGDGDEDSDIDILLVHPPFPGEKKPKGLTAGLSAQVADALGAAVLASEQVDAADRWEEQVDRLRELVHAWTGNHAQVVDLTFHEWRRPPPEQRPLLANVEQDGIELVKARGLKLWRAAAGQDA